MPMALIVGHSGITGDRAIEVFRSKTLKLGYDCEQESAHAKAAARFTAHQEGVDLILFCVPESLNRAEKYLEEIRHASRRVIVYTHERRASSVVAVDYLKKGLADGYVAGEGPIEESMEELILSLCAYGHPHYPRIDFKPPEGGRAPCVFISTPFEHSTMMVARGAIQYPLQALGFEVKLEGRDYWRCLQSQIVSDIQSSSLLVANVSLDPRNLLHNANVYFEAGVATALGLPIVFVRKRNEMSIALPADVQGRLWLSYDNEIDLALKLFCGLRQSIRRSAGAAG